jgi:RNA-directed DNA polymerase
MRFRKVGAGQRWLSLGLRIFRFFEEALSRPARPHLMDRTLAETYGRPATREAALGHHPLPNRLAGKLNGLLLHPDKTRFVDFRNNRPNGTNHPETDGITFLGFSHIWGKSRAGKNVVRQVTAKNRYARALAAVTAWCRVNRHQPMYREIGTIRRR